MLFNTQNTQYPSATVSPFSQHFITFVDVNDLLSLFPFNQSLCFSEFFQNCLSNKRHYNTKIKGKIAQYMIFPAEVSHLSTHSCAHQLSSCHHSTGITHAHPLWQNTAHLSQTLFIHILRLVILFPDFYLDLWSMYVCK